MINQINQGIKDFSVEKINKLLKQYSIDSDTLTEGSDWESKLRSKVKYSEVEAYVEQLYQDIISKRGLVNKIFSPASPTSPTFNNDYSGFLRNDFKDLENRFVDLIQVMKTKIGVEPTDDTLATNEKGDDIFYDGRKIPQWRYVIEKKLPNEVKLTGIPDVSDLPIILYERDLYSEIINGKNGLKDIITRDLADSEKIVKYGSEFNFKVNKVKLQEYKVAQNISLEFENLARENLKKLTDRENEIKSVLRLEDIPENWHSNTKILLSFLADKLNVSPPDKLDNLPTIPDGEDLNSLLARPTQKELDKVNNQIKDLEKLFKQILEMKQSVNCPDNYRDLVALYNSKSGSATIIKLKNLADQYQTINTKLNGKNLDTLINHTCPETTPRSTSCHDVAHKDYHARYNESQEYQRISAKLNNKVSDNDLDALFNNAPTCSHTDYDTLKQAHDQLQHNFANQTTQKEAFQKKLNTAQNLNLGLAVLTIGSLLTLAGMIIKPIKNKLPETKKTN